MFDESTFGTIPSAHRGLGGLLPTEVVSTHAPAQIGMVADQPAAPESEGGAP